MTENSGKNKRTIFTLNLHVVLCTEIIYFLCFSWGGGGGGIKRIIRELGGFFQSPLLINTEAY